MSYKATPTPKTYKGNYGDAWPNFNGMQEWERAFDTSTQPYQEWIWVEGSPEANIDQEQLVSDRDSPLKGRKYGSDFTLTKGHFSGVSLDFVNQWWEWVIKVSIQGVANNLPDGNIIASKYIDASELSSSGTEYFYKMDLPSLSGRYYLVVDGVGITAWQVQIRSSIATKNYWAIWSEGEGEHRPLWVNRAPQLYFKTHYYDASRVKSGSKPALPNFTDAENVVAYLTPFLRYIRYDTGNEADGGWVSMAIEEYNWYLYVFTVYLRIERTSTRDNHGCYCFVDKFDPFTNKIIAQYELNTNQGDDHLGAFHIRRSGTKIYMGSDPYDNWFQVTIPQHVYFDMATETWTHAWASGGTIYFNKSNPWGFLRTADVFHTTDFPTTEYDVNAPNSTAPSYTSLAANTNSNLNMSAIGNAANTSVVLNGKTYTPKCLATLTYGWWAYMSYLIKT